MSFRELDHTADLAIEVTAPDPPRLLAESARALTSCITDLETIEARQGLRVELAADSLEGLLVAFLSELLFRFETGGFLAAQALVALEERPPGWSLDAHLRGEPFDVERHAFRTAVKGITWHGLEVSEFGDGWRARLVLDV